MIMFYNFPQFDISNISFEKGKPLQFYFSHLLSDKLGRGLSVFD